MHSSTMSKNQRSYLLIGLAGIIAVLYVVLTAASVVFIIDLWGSWFTQIDHKHPKWQDFGMPFFQASIAVYLTSVLMFEAWNHFMRSCFVNEANPGTTTRVYRILSTMFRESIHIVNAILWAVVAKKFSNLPPVPSEQAHGDYERAMHRFEPIMPLAIVCAVLVSIEEVAYWLVCEKGNKQTKTLPERREDFAPYHDEE